MKFKVYIDRILKRIDPIYPGFGDPRRGSCKDQKENGPPVPGITFGDPRNGGPARIKKKTAFGLFS